MLNTVLVILQGLLPLATLYLIKRIIDAVTAVKSAGASSAGLSPGLSTVLPLVALAGGSVLLDSLAEAELLHHFCRLIGGRSAILISHRFATVRMADRIYVMADGGIAEEGTHGELMERNGLYARMVHAQASDMPDSL
jgi:hypothetical protein